MKKLKRHSEHFAFHEGRVFAASGPRHSQDFSRQPPDIRLAGCRALESRIRAVVERISRDPPSAPEVEQRSSIHVVPLIRYPFKIFYRVLDDRVRIMHIRHNARRPWRGED